jgi:hypothetical protein
VARGLAVATDDKPRVEHEGGEYRAGLIRGAAVITRGEAAGHGMWIDETMLKDTADAINAADKGIKSRFTHPSLSGDGLGKALGRFRKATVDGDLVRADLHVFATAHETPDGDLAAYTMGLAEEDPAAFGTSIAFSPDIGAESKFVGEHSDEDGTFTSPDEANTKNYPHARLHELMAIDAVDDPAANPDGLFHRGGELVAEADGLLAYVFGLTDDAPDAMQFGMAPERVRSFVLRWLDRNNLTIWRSWGTGDEKEIMATVAAPTTTEASGIVTEDVCVCAMGKALCDRCRRGIELFHAKRQRARARELELDGD